MGKWFYVEKCKWVIIWKDFVASMLDFYGSRHFSIGNF